MNEFRYLIDVWGVGNYTREYLNDTLECLELVIKYPLICRRAFTPQLFSYSSLLVL